MDIRDGIITGTFAIGSDGRNSARIITLWRWGGMRGVIIGAADRPQCTIHGVSGMFASVGRKTVRVGMCRAGCGVMEGFAIGRQIVR